MHIVRNAECEEAEGGVRGALMLGGEHQAVVFSTGWGGCGKLEVLCRSW